jgi:hypothetical protein
MKGPTWVRFRGRLKIVENVFDEINHFIGGVLATPLRRKSFKRIGKKEIKKEKKRDFETCPSTAMRMTFHENRRLLTPSSKHRQATTPSSLLAMILLSLPL